MVLKIGIDRVMKKIKYSLISSLVVLAIVILAGKGVDSVVINSGSCMSNQDKSSVLSSESVSEQKKKDERIDPEKTRIALMSF